MDRNQALDRNQVRDRVRDRGAAYHPAADRHRPIVLRRRGAAAERSGTTGPRVLLLHGLGNSGTVWDALEAHSAAHVDLRTAELWSAELPWRLGGLAEWSERTEADIWVGRALDAMRETAGGGADVVVAHSYAAGALLELLCGEGEAALSGPKAATSGAAAHRGIGGLVLVSPFFRARPEEFGWEAVAGLAEKFVRTMEEGIRVVAGQRGDQSLHRAMAERVCEAIGPYGWLRFLELYLRTPWLRTEGLSVPSVVVCGGADSIAVPEEGRALAARLPSAEWRQVDGSGHFPMIERSGQFADVLGAFLAETATARAVESGTAAQTAAATESGTGSKTAGRGAGASLVPLGPSERE